MDINQKTHILSILAPVVSEQEYNEVAAALTAVVQNGTADLAALPNQLDVATLREVLSDFIDEVGYATNDTTYLFIAQLGVCGLSVIPNTQLAAIRRANTAAAPIVAAGRPSTGPSKCSPLSCDGCATCEPQVAQGLPVQEGGSRG